MQFIREVTLPVPCDICGRLCTKYLFDEEEGLLKCIECVEANEI